MIQMAKQPPIPCTKESINEHRIKTEHNCYCKNCTRINIRIIISFKR